VKLLYFWQRHCPFCTQVKTRGVLEDFARQTGVSVHREDLSGGLTELASQYRVRSVPSYILIDERGEVVRRGTGMRTAGQLVRWVS
jgi:thioredoxin-related protein